MFTLVETSGPLGVGAGSATIGCGGGQLRFLPQPPVTVTRASVEI